MEPEPSTGPTQPASGPTGPRLQVARILAAGAIAPLRLDARFWRRAGPIAVATVIALAAVSFGRVLMYVPWLLVSCALVIPGTLIMVPYHRAVLTLGEDPAGGGWWGRRETCYAVALLVLSMLSMLSTYAVIGLAGPLLAVAMLFVGDAYAVVAVVGGVVALLAGAGWILLITPMALALPAIAAGHPFAPARLWRLARGSRWRLAVTVAAYPLVSRVLPVHLLAMTMGWLVSPLVQLVSFYLTLALLGSVSFAYHALSDEPLEARPAALDGLAAHPAVRWVTPLAFVWVLAGLGGLWAVTNMPGLDPTRQKAPAADPYLVEGEERLLTSDKQVVNLRYEVRWRVADEQRYEVATASDPRRVAHYLRNVANDVLRNHVARRPFAELDADAPPDTLLPLEPIEELLGELGVKVTHRRIIGIERVAR